MTLAQMNQISCEAQQIAVLFFFFPNHTFPAIRIHIPGQADFIAIIQAGNPLLQVGKAITCRIRSLSPRANVNRRGVS